MATRKIAYRHNPDGTTVELSCRFTGGDAYQDMKADARQTRATVTGSTNGFRLNPDGVASQDGKRLVTNGNWTQPNMPGYRWQLTSEWRQLPHGVEN